jgi:hypothetical protein
MVLEKRIEPNAAIPSREWLHIAASPVHRVRRNALANLLFYRLCCVPSPSSSWRTPSKGEGCEGSLYFVNCASTIGFHHPAMTKSARLRHEKQWRLRNMKML